MKNPAGEFREEHAWTEVDPGDPLGVSRQTTHAIETGNAGGFHSIVPDTAPRMESRRCPLKRATVV